MSKAAKIKTEPTFSEELQEMTSRSANRGERVFVAGVAGLLGAVALAVAGWFWQAVLLDHDRPQLQLIAIAAAGVLAAAAIGAWVGAVLLLLRKRLAGPILSGATQAGSIAAMVIVINSIIHFIRQTEGLRGLMASFLDFNRIDIGPMSISITGTLTIMAIIAGVTAGLNTTKRKK